MKHARLASLHAEASAEQRQAEDDVRASDIESGSFKALVSARRLVADRAAEIDARLTQVAQELASAKAATVAAVQATEEAERARVAAALKAESETLEKDCDALVLECAGKLAVMVARIREINKGRPFEQAPTLWQGALPGRELHAAIRLKALEDRAQKITAIGNSDPERAIQFAIGKVSA